MKIVNMEFVLGNLTTFAAEYNQKFSDITVLLIGPLKNSAPLLPSSLPLLLPSAVLATTMRGRTLLLPVKHVRESLLPTTMLRVVIPSLNILLPVIRPVSASMDNVLSRTTVRI